MLEMMDDGECKLISGAFGLAVQGTLLACCFAVLFIKRLRESPRRPWLIWFFDLSKQAFSSGLQHGANLLFGVSLARDGRASQCGWYFVLYVITSTAAILVVAAAMAAVNWLVVRYQCLLLKTGEYGSPPSWRTWLVQLLVWGAIGLGEKVLTTFSLVVPFRRTLGELAAWLEQPLLPYPHLELILIMVVTPVLLNIISVVIFDNIMKHKKGSGASEEGGGSPSSSCAAQHMPFPATRCSRAALRDPLIASRAEAEAEDAAAARTCEEGALPPPRRHR